MHVVQELHYHLLFPRNVRIFIMSAELRQPGSHQCQHRVHETDEDFRAEFQIRIFVSPTETLVIFHEHIAQFVA